MSYPRDWVITTPIPPTYTHGTQGRLWVGVWESCWPDASLTCHEGGEAGVRKDHTWVLGYPDFWVQTGAWGSPAPSPPSYPGG